MATAGPEIGRYIIDRLGEREIGFHPLTKVGRVEGDRRAVVLEDGTSIPYDLLIAIPPHEAPKAVRESGLTGSGGWIPVDSRTLQLSAGEENRVFAIGDVSSVPLPGRFAPDVPLVLPKAGVFAEAQAKVVANRIATHVLGRAPEGEFDGVGFCYIELGGDAAIRGDGSFFDLPHPSMTPSEPSAGQLELKKAWVQSWMATYL
jgi:sulfide:quinone oxidoreductase